MEKGRRRMENGARIIQFSIFPDRRREDESEVENFRHLLSVANKKAVANSTYFGIGENIAGN